MLSSLRSKLLSSEEGNTFLSSLKFQSCLGLGGFGIVLRAINPTCQTNPTPTAVKLIFPSEVQNEKEEKQIFRECQLASTFNHENIVKILNVAGKQFKASEIEKIFKHWSKDDERYLTLRDTYVAKAKRYKTVEFICIQMELCGETLKKWLHQQHDQTEEVKETQKQICRDVVMGLKYLHDQKIIHRDLKPENIMFSASGFKLPVKIGDFGLCRVLHSNPESKTGSLTSRTGTFEYMAPEAFSSAYTFQTDIFSVGLVIWEVVQLIKFHDRRNFFDALVGDKDEGVVQLPAFFNLLGSCIVNLTKKKITERAKDLDEVSSILQEMTQNLEYVRSTEELKISLRDVERGGKITLAEGVFPGEFILETDGVEIVGQGPRKTILRGMNYKTGFHVRGSDCTISGLTIITGDKMVFSSVGIYLKGWQNKIQNVEVSGGETCIYVEGNQNQLVDLTIANAVNGIEIHGSNNTLSRILLEDNDNSGIRPLSTPFSPNIPLDMGVGIGVGGSNNALSHIFLIRGRPKGKKLDGVWLHSSGSHNTLSNLTCSGYSREKEDWALRMHSQSSSVKDSDCGPISVDGKNPTLINVNCGEEISIQENATGVILTKCRGQMLMFYKQIATTDCHFDKTTEFHTKF